ncbi:Rad2 nuclease [Chytriomyces hyalinus]|nr:Rad2 nuclease [Chytriomyces hyalinus]
MGISGLLPLLEPIKKNKHLRDYAGMRVAVDTYVWLHRAAFGCAMDLGLGKKTTAYVSFCMKRVALLRQFGITPVLVFDGGCLPMKSHTERERRLRRQEAKKKAHEELLKGDTSKAMEMFQQCVNITPNMALELIKALRKEKIEFIVAPYEADAQLAYLEKIGKVDAVLTEDSDLLVFGCQRVLLKLDANGSVVEINARDFPHVPCMKRGWTFAKFRQACILSGCDYLPSLKGVGIKKAFDTLNSSSSIERTLKTWRTFGFSIKAPKMRDGYETAFKEAELTFLYQRVYDPDKKRLVHLNEPILSDLDFMEDLCKFLGRDLEPSVAEGIAIGELNPYTLRPYHPDDDFFYEDLDAKDDEATRHNPIKPTPVPHVPKDLSASARILQVSTTANLTGQYTTKSSDSTSKFFSQSEKPTIDVDEHVYSSSFPITKNDLELKAAEPSPIASLSRFRSTSINPLDDFSYHSTVLKSKAHAVDSNNVSPVRLTPVIPPRPALHLLKRSVTEMDSFSYEHVQIRKVTTDGNKTDGENSSPAKVAVESWVTEEASVKIHLESARYMEQTNPHQHRPYKPPAVMPKTKAVFGSAFDGLSTFRSSSASEQHVYQSGDNSSSLKPKKARPAPSLPKKRLGAGRPTNLIPITAFFGK